MDWKYYWERFLATASLYIFAFIYACISIYYIYIFHFNKQKMINDPRLFFLLSTRSFLLSRHLPPCFPHPLQPWHSYIIAFGKLCDTPPPPSPIDSLQSHIVLICYVWGRGDKIPRQTYHSLFCYCAVEHRVTFICSFKRKKILPIKDWIRGPLFQCWETLDKVKSPLYQLSTIPHNFCIVCLCVVSCLWAHCFWAHEALSVLRTWLAFCCGSKC